MTSTLELYRRIGNRETTSQKWNDLSNEERQAYTKLAQGCIALVKLHNVEERELAKYLMQYTAIMQP